MSMFFRLVLLTILLAPLSISAQQSTENIGQPINSRPVLQLESTIRGSREQPKVLSIVPWQPPSNKQPLPSLVVRQINQQFKALNRDEFRRRLKHYEKLSEK